MDDDSTPAGLAAFYLEAGYPREALDALRGTDPNDVQTVYVRGRALAQLGRDKEAEDVVRRGLEIEPENVFFLELLASIQTIDDPLTAEKTIRSALQREPDNPWLLRPYVVVLLRQRRYEAAEQMLERLMRVAPDDELTLRARTFFLLHASRSQEALQAARELLRQFPDDADAHYLQGLALLSGPWWKAFRHLRRAAALRPQDPVMVETARVMRSWYLWPVHLTSGVVHYAITGSVAIVAMLHFSHEEPGWIWWFLGVLAFTGCKWLLAFIAQGVLSRRVARTMRH